MKKILSLFLFVCVLNLNAQDKVLDFKFKEKYKYLNNYTSNIGLNYVISGSKKNNGDVNISCFDKNLDLVYQKDYNSNFRGLGSFFGRGVSTPNIFYKLELSKDSNYSWTQHDNFIFNGKGEYKLNDFDSSEKNKEFETVFQIMSGNNACYFGYVLDKKINKDEKYNDNYFYKVNLNDLSKKLVKIDFPKFPLLIKGEMNKKIDKKETWGISSYNKDQFLMLNKQYSKLRNEDQYNIAIYDYDGNLKKSLNLYLKLDNKYFSSSNTGFGNVKIVFSPNVSAGYMGKSATGNIFIEGDNEFFYVYGIYTNVKNSDVNAVNYHGFYIYKFNSKGELVWKQEKAINDKRFNAKQRPFVITSNFMKKPNGQLSFNVDNFYEKYALMFLLDDKDGKLIQSDDINFKIEGNRLEGINVSAFPTGYSVKETYPNLHFDLNTLYAMYLQPKIADYLKQYINSKEDINFNSEITKEGIYVIQENEKTESIKLLKFNW